MTTTVALLLLAGSALVQSQPHFVSYIATIGSQWTTAEYNEGFLKYIGVPGYGGSRGYNVLNFAFWVSTSNNGGAAINGAATAWQTIEKYITSSALKIKLTGSSTASPDQLRAAIHKIYNDAGIEIFISAFGGTDHPMGGNKAAIATADALAAYAKKYDFDGVDVDWEEAYYGKFGAGQGGATWLCALTNRLRSQLNSNQKITHAPQAPYFMGTGKYADGGYLTVHKNCGNNIDWYNVQFYNQDSTTYNTYARLFTKSIGWSTNSGVYQIMAGGDGSVSGVSSIPSSKVVVGKHTLGDGSTFVSGATLKGIFTSALAARQWNAGFMTWQFYKEISAASGQALIDQVLDAPGWSSSVSTFSPAPTTSTTRPATNCGTAGTLKIVNKDSISGWFYAGYVSGKPAGWLVSKFEVQLSNGQWHNCNPSVTWFKCETLPVQISYPTSVRVTANGETVTVSNKITATTGASVDSFTNFGCSSSGTTTTRAATTTTSRATTTTRAAATTTRATTTRGNNGGGSGKVTVISRAGSNGWWYTCTVTAPAVTITKVEMRSAGCTEETCWVTGGYAEWGNYYTFGGPITTPMSFRITSSDGQVVVAQDLVDSFSAGAQGTSEQGFNASFTAENGEDEDAVSWTIWFAVILMVLVVIGLIVGGYCMWRRKRKGKGYTSDTLELKENEGVTTKGGTELIEVDVVDEQQAEDEAPIKVTTAQ